MQKSKKNVVKSHQSGPGNDWFRVSTSDTNQSDIVSFVRFVQTVARSFHNTWRICIKHQILQSKLEIWDIKIVNQLRSPDTTRLGIEGRSELAEYPSFLAAGTEKGGILHYLYTAKLLRFPSFFTASTKKEAIYTQ